MQALEMEEVESLVGTGRKKLNASRKGPGRGDGGDLASLATGRNFMTNVIGAACIALFVLFYVSMKSGTGGSGGTDIEVKPGYHTEVVDAVPTSPPAVETPGSGGPPPPPPPPQPTDPPVNNPEPAPTDPPATDPPATATVTVTATPVAVPDPATTPIVSSNPEDADKNLYSKVATFHPLTDTPLPDAEKSTELAHKWGKWNFWDGDEAMRPTSDYLSKYPNRDCPGDAFPDTAWQVDAVFVNHYLDVADRLISRAMEVIFTEYGHSREGMKPQQLAERFQQFHWEKVDLTEETQPPEKYRRRGDQGNGGWTTKRSEKGLVRRLLHAMMTSDTFTVVMGGHSAAAGEGNHFRQSYMMQFHKVMAPVFAHLGVKLVTRNMAMGGLGTLHNTLGLGDIYGDEIDLLIWDTGMTEGKDLKAVDMFIRQGLIGGKRVPVVWGAGDIAFDLLKLFHEEADADIGSFGQAKDGIPSVESSTQAGGIPYAARYMKCTEEAQALCDEEPRFCAVCWIDREDGIKPTERQRATPKGQVSWHPGWRAHQLVGRNLAMAVLQSLQNAINLWNDQVAGGPPLMDEEWHVTDYYANIRNKIVNMDKSLGNCKEFEGLLPDRICTTPMKGATQYTPRANPEKTSLTSISKPAPDGYVPKNEKQTLYEGPDVPIPCLQIPEGEVDVYGIVAGRQRRLEEGLAGDSALVQLPQNQTASATGVSAVSITKGRSLDTGIIPGKGWQVFAEPPGYCDGTYDAVCKRDGTIQCVLPGHHADRGAIVGNGLSGWLVLNLKDVKEGIIILKLQTWHFPSENTVTDGWTAANNERVRRRQEGRHGQEKGRRNIQTRPTEILDDGRVVTESEFIDDSYDGYDGIVGERRLWRGTETPEQPETMVFEYAIDGQITSLPRDEFLEKKAQLQRVVETLTILDDPSFTSEARDVEVAIRMLGCERTCTFGLSHVYWA